MVPFKLLARAMSNAAPAPLAYLLAAFFRLRGLMKWPLQPMYAVGEHGSERTVQRDEMPGRALARWAPITEQLEDLGFRALKYQIADVIGEKEQVAALFLDASGTTVATLEWLRMRGADGFEERSPLEFNSYGDDDPEVMTAAMTDEDLVLADMLQLEFVDSVLLSNRTPIRQLYERHEARVQRRSVYQMTPDAALEEHEKRSERRFSWVVRRGLLRPLRQAEVEMLKRKKTADQIDGTDASPPAAASS